MTTVASEPRMSAEQYLAWEADQVERHEFFRGEVFAMAGGSPRHNALSAAVTIELGVALRGGNCRILSADQRIAARRNEHYGYADASVVCGAIELLRDTTDVLANPSVVVEVLSKRTEAYDRGLKWDRPSPLRPKFRRLIPMRPHRLFPQPSRRHRPMRLACAFRTP